MTVLSVNNLRLLVDVSTHKIDKTISSAIEAVELSYIKTFFKDEVFTLLLKNAEASPSNSFVDLILEGGFYYNESYSPSKEVYFNGLNKAIALLTYCDLMVNQTVITRYGAVNKNDSNSNKPDFASVLEQISRYRKTAILQIEDVDNFLRNCETAEYSETITDLLTAYRLECNGKIEGILNEWL